MTPTTDKVPRLWPLRLLQLSPLIVFAVAAGVWFMMTPALRSTALQLATPGGAGGDLLYGEQAPAELLALRTLDSEMQLQTQQNGTGGGTDAVSEFQLAADGTTSRVMASPWRLYDELDALRPLAIPAGDEVFVALDHAEKTPGVGIGAFVIPPRPDPPVALAAVESLNWLNSAERSEYEASGTVESLRRTVRQTGTSPVPSGDATAPTMPPDELPVDIENLTSEVQKADSNRVINYATRSIGGHIYEVYSGYRRSRPGNEQGGGAPMLPDDKALDTPQNRRALEQFAKLTGGAAFVVGPTDGEPVLLRAPRGTTATGTLELIESTPLALGLAQGLGVRKTDSAPLRLASTAPWTATTVSFAPAPQSTPPQGKTGALHPVAYIAFWNEHPDIPLLWARVGRTPLRVLRVWITTKSAYIFGALAMLFLASLIAAPLAFARERRLTFELELERERERVRREARERVLDRLTELSERIDAAATIAPADASGEIALAARDIDSTVSELRRILGDLAVEQGGSDA